MGACASQRGLWVDTPGRGQARRTRAAVTTVRAAAASAGSWVPSRDGQVLSDSRNPEGQHPSAPKTQPFLPLSLSVSLPGTAIERKRGPRKGAVVRAGGSKTPQEHAEGKTAAGAADSAAATRPGLRGSAGDGGRGSPTFPARRSRPPELPRGTARAARGPRRGRREDAGGAGSSAAEGRGRYRDSPSRRTAGGSRRATPPETGLGARAPSVPQTSGRSGRLGVSAVSVVPIPAAGASGKGRGQSGRAS